MSAVAIITSIVVAFVGLAGVTITAWAGLRANTLRLHAEEKAKLVEEERQREAAEAVARKAEADALRLERDRILAYHQDLHATHLAEIGRLSAARDRENAEVQRLRVLLAAKENP